MTSGWSIYIIVLTVGNILACAWLLWWTSRRPATESVESETTGHVWDGDLQEYNNPLPRWWLVLFYFTIVFAFVYLALYPGLGRFEGVLGWTQIMEYEQESARITERQRETFARFAGKDLAVLAADAEATDIGSRIFANNCAVCHGSDGRGAPGFPNLADDDWLYGDDAQQLLASIRHGRNGMMPPLGGALGEQGVAQVAAYVYQLNGRSTDAAMASLVADGERLFGMQCAACHGVEGKGNTMLGAPNLADDTWLYGDSFEMIKRTVRDGRNGRMPAHEKLLSEDQIRLVAAYVLSLSQQQEGQ